MCNTTIRAGDCYELTRRVSSVSEPTLTGPVPINGPWEVAVNGHVFVNGLPSRDLARRIAASWNRQQRKGQEPRFRARRSDAT